MLLPEYVFLEVTTVIALKRGLATAIQVGSILLNANEVEIVPCSGIFEEAWRRFQTQGSGPLLSFVDSALAALAENRGAEYLATSDNGFGKISELMRIPNTD